MSIPLLPETAPFTASQRSYLNGFLAGLLSSEPIPSLSAAPAAAPTALSPSPGNDADADLPWHDPILPIDQRLALAEDRPLEDQLMAAMAQLDCGACGYLCRTYSRAIAERQEPDLTRCAPGGRETVRTLKSLMKSTTAKNVSVSAGPSPTSSTGYDRQRPFAAPLLSVKPLNKPGSEKDTRFVALDLAGSGLSYDVGDSLGVYPENCPSLVDEVLATLGAGGDEHVPSPDGARPFREALLKFCTITSVDEDLLNILAQSASASDRASLLSLAQEPQQLDALDLLDVLGCFASARPDPAVLVAALPPLAPRLYSISSSLKAHADEVHLTVGVVRYEHRGRWRNGVASTFFADRAQLGQGVRVFIQKAHGFGLPPDPSTPIIMIGPGTGIAPFRAFLQEREAAGATGRNWLLFGDRRRAFDFLYEHELTRWLDGGLLCRLDLAFSRDADRKLYVQHRMLEHGAELWRWLQDGAHLYVCGDAKRMAADVDRALHRVVAEQGAVSEAQAHEFVAELARTGRYQRDVY